MLSGFINYDTLSSAEDFTRTKGGLGGLSTERQRGALHARGEHSIIALLHNMLMRWSQDINASYQRVQF
jgi:hypothetical protein